MAGLDVLGSTSGVLCTEHDLVLLDLDGVVYAGPLAIPGVADRLARCREAGSPPRLRDQQRVPASRRRSPQHLRDLGIDADDDAVVTVGPGSRAAGRRGGAGGLVGAGRGRRGAGGGAGRARPAGGVVRATTSRPRWFRGSTRRWDGELLAEGAYALATGIPWVASNLDRTVPTDRGRAPGNGTLVDALRAASGREPTVAGKPERGAVRRGAAAARGQPVRSWSATGIDTDIAGASRAGVPSLLVLTGVSLAGGRLRCQGRRPADVRRARPRGAAAARTPRSSRLPPGRVAGTGGRSSATVGLCCRAPIDRGARGCRARWPPCGRWWPRAGPAAGRARRRPRDGDRPARHGRRRAPPSGDCAT